MYHSFPAVSSLFSDFFHRAALSAPALSVLRGLDPAGRVGLTRCPLIATPMLLGAVRPLIVLPVGIEERERLGITFDFRQIRQSRQKFDGKIFFGFSSDGIDSGDALCYTLFN